MRRKPHGFFDLEVRDATDRKLAMSTSRLLVAEGAGGIATDAYDALVTFLLHHASAKDRLVFYHLTFHLRLLIYEIWALALCNDTRFLSSWSDHFWAFDDFERLALGLCRFTMAAILIGLDKMLLGVFVPWLLE